jgi:hypothetical protein
VEGSHMRTQNIIEAWEKPTSAHSKQHISSPRLPIELAAKLAALHELYPQQTEAQLASDLITHALAQMQHKLDIQH